MDKTDLKKRAKNIQKIRLDRERAVFMKLGAKIRAYFFTGILVTAPVSITFYMAYNIFLWVDSSVNRLIPPELLSRYNIPVTMPGVGIIVLILMMILIGMFAAGFIGRFFLHLGDWIVRRLPVISSIYSLLKQVFETFLSSQKQWSSVLSLCPVEITRILLLCSIAICVLIAAIDNVFPVCSFLLFQNVTIDIFYFILPKN